VQETLLETFREQNEKDIQSPRAARGSLWTKRSVEQGSNVEMAFDMSPAIVT
jgi:hypothetical protein